MDSSAAMSITELFEISTLFVSSLKPPPRYKRVEPMVCGSCSSWLHVLHKKFRSPALLAETEKNSCGSGALYCSLTSNSLAVLTGHTYAVALKTSSQLDYIGHSGSVQSRCHQVHPSEDCAGIALQYLQMFHPFRSSSAIYYI